MVMLALVAVAACAASAAAAEPEAGGSTAALVRAAAGLRLGLPAREVPAGEVVEITWSALPHEVEELEILLSVDGGRHYGLRVTPECDPGARRFLWRVPNLVTGAARLRARLGSHGQEIEAAPGEGFAIVGAEAGPFADPAFHERGWWSALDALPAAPQPGPAVQQARSALRDPRAAGPPPRDALAPAPAAPAGGVASTSASAPSLPQIRPAPHGRYAPLRE
jgi:hypothetical protein